jgi:hypothetical protein
MNSEKIKVIIKWETSTHLKKFQTFLNFINFYRWFIKNFSRIAKSLINLIKKKRFFVWNNTCQKIFEELKRRIIETLVLSYFFSKLKTFLKSNSFDYVSIEVLSQKENDDLIRSVTYFSKKFSFAQCNYEIYDKELIIIIKYFKQW